MDTQTLNVGWMVCSFVLLVIVLGQAWALNRMGKQVGEAYTALRAAATTVGALAVGEAEIVRTGPKPEDFQIRLKEGVK